MKTKVVNLYKEQYDVYIGRAGKGRDGYFGNPFPLLKGDERGSTLEKYKQWFYNRLKIDREFELKISELKGKTLGCFCKPNACHGDIIKEYLDSHTDFVERHLEQVNIKMDLAREKYNKTEKK